MMALNSGHCAVNTATLGFQWPIERSIEAIAAAGFGGIAPWRREVEGQDVLVACRILRLLLAQTLTEGGRGGAGVEVWAA